MKVDDVPEIAKMSTPEKILFIENLWDSVSSMDSEVPVPESHREELDARLAKDYSPGDLLSIEELQNRIEKRK
ncbi:MAG: addiction module protein [Planctomycetes bacterium RBG_16_41_13]|nr:MAG: addiction module protein [Planctomycetes bacterium RBG_16_41_13]